MPRVLPEVPYTCYICGTQFIISNEGFSPFDPQSRAQLRTPIACPCCAAPERHQLVNQAHAGEMLIGAYYGGKAYQEKLQVPPPLEFLTEQLVTPEAIDACLDQVARVDLNAWERSVRESLAQGSDAESAAEARVELEAIARARKDAERGELVNNLRTLAEQAKQQLREERARSMEIYQERCGSGQRPPRVVYRFKREQEDA